MDKWQALLPDKPVNPKQNHVDLNLHGRLSEDAYIVILQYLPIPDFCAFARVCRRFAGLTKDDRVWKAKLGWLDYRGPGAIEWNLLKQITGQAGKRRSVLPSPSKSNFNILNGQNGYGKEDEFGEFLGVGEDDFGDFQQVPIGGFDGFSTPTPKDDLLILFDDEPSSKPKPKPRPDNFLKSNSQQPLYNVFIETFNILLPYYISFKTHSTSSLIFTSSLTQRDKALTLSALDRFCGALLAPTRSLPQRESVRRNIQSGVDFFESALLTEFDRAEKKGDEETMKEKAAIMWELGGKNMNLIPIFIQRREILFDQPHDPLKNLVKVRSLTGEMVDGIDFSAMDMFMAEILKSIKIDGSLIARVFPAQADVLIQFIERIASDVISDYAMDLLSDAQNLQPPLFLLATAATFGQVSRLSEAVMDVEPKNKLIAKDRVMEIVYRIFDQHMDDYLQEEGDYIRQVLERACEEWDAKSAAELAFSDPTFLASQNPAMVKKNVVAGFTKALLLPVTIIPKTAAMGLSAITYGATGAFNTFASISNSLARGGNTNQLEQLPVDTSVEEWGKASETVKELESPSLTDANEPSKRNSTNSKFNQMQLLLSLDTALQMIQSDRDCLLRVQTFIGYPGLYGMRVRDTIEEIFVILLQTLAEKHVCPGFAKATAQMGNYKPEEHESEIQVAPLVQFFELVHIGDTIQQMVDVFYTKGISSFIDKKDFLNPVFREKKRFETLLDDAVAQGLNAAVNILMNQVEHIISLQDPIDFNPSDEVDLDLSPTKTCTKTISVLAQHCSLLKGSTDKQILEVFQSEIGIRLHGILLKHLKRIVVSAAGGFQLIADLNSYHQFITSLKRPTVTAYFTALKMAGELFIIESPKDLGMVVRDVSRYDGTLSTEDLYEIVQRRADWVKIQKEVDKGLYGFSSKEDCIVC